MILMLLVILNVGASTYVKPPFKSDLSDLKFLELNKKDSVYTEGKVYAERKSDVAKNKSKLFYFDPNSIGLSQWIELGFSKKQSEVIIGYRDNYGPFRAKEELKKVYVISTEKYNELEKYIQIQSNLSESKNHLYKNNEEPESKSFQRVELNTCTLEEVKTIKGIGDYYGNKLIALRTKLGGFVNFEQIEEGLYAPLEVLNVIEDNAVISPNLVQKQNINTISKAELKRIPYMNWKAVAAVLKEREKQKISNLEFLDEEDLNLENQKKILFYLKFD
jgi:DNA uptake protein ComE-like DNA-binding protein